MIESLFGTLHHFFGDFIERFRSISDPRRQHQVTYPLSCLLFTAVLMFLCRLGARRQIRFSLAGEETTEKYKVLFLVENIPHGDTIETVFERLRIEEVSEVVTAMTETLIRKKVLYPYRLLDQYFTIVIDGTGMLSFPKRHCQHCLWSRAGNQTLFYHSVLEAKLVTPTGFAFSIMTEFIENTDEKVPKQDCEQKAFFRLVKRLKKRFPRLPICLIGDAQFAQKNVFLLCQQFGWKYLITFKESDMPAVFEEFKETCLLQPENKSILLTGKNLHTSQKFRWATEVACFDRHDRFSYYVNILECIETKPHCSTKFMWLTNLKITSKNCTEIANQGGRLRWKIENEGFNVQKNGGFGLEHAYSRHPQSMKIFYYLLQISHILTQLVEKGSLFKKIFPRGLGSSKNLAAKLKEEWIYKKVAASVWSSLSTLSLQIRFDTS